VKVTKDYHGEKFFVHLPDGFHFTPLFLVLILVEISDVVFAVDSVPAIFGITNDPFIIFTSNIFAILGLRSMFFLLVHAAEKFYYIRHGVGVILVFIGIKMLTAHWYKLPIAIALSVVIGILVFCILLSVMRKPDKPTTSH
jgi:tellurite resistance protein TerC